MVPVKEGVQALTGLKTMWDQTKKEAVINYWEWGVVRIPVGQKWMIYRDTKTDLVTETEIVNGRIRVMKRERASLFGCLCFVIYWE